MTRIITEEAVADRLAVGEVVSTIETMFEEFGTAQAATDTREDILTPAPGMSGDADGPVYHLLKTMGGVLPALEVGAVRINSNLVTWRRRNGSTTKGKLPGPDGRFTGLVLLFSTRTGEPLAVFPDGVIQTYRVAATSAVAAKHLAREDASELGLLGAGPQAKAHLLAFDGLFDLDAVRVYTPTPTSREEFAAWASGEVQADVTAVDTPEAALAGAELTQCATNSLDPVFELDWLDPGAHVCVLNKNEPPDEFFDPDGFDAFVQSWPKITIHEEIGATLTERRMPTKNINYYVVEGEEPVPELTASRATSQPLCDWERVPALHEVLAGEVGRSSPEGITAFFNRGFGTQFAAAGWALYQLAEREELGHVVPTEWLTQEVQGT